MTKRKCRGSIRGPCSSSESGIGTGRFWWASPSPEPSSPSSLSVSPVTTPDLFRLRFLAAYTKILIFSFDQTCCPLIYNSQRKMRRTLPSFRGTRNTRGNFSNRQTLDFICYNAYLVPIPVFSDDLENPNLHELRRDMETTL